MAKQRHPEGNRPGASLAFRASGPVLVPEGSSLEVPIVVFGLRERVRDVTVSVHVRHRAMGILSLALVSPDARGVLLSALSGGAATSFGESPSKPLVFTDHALIGIGEAPPPYAGSYRPVGSLAVFNGLSPLRANGWWRLVVSDIGSRGASALVAGATLTFRR